MSMLEDLAARLAALLSALPVGQLDHAGDTLSEASGRVAAVRGSSSHPALVNSTHRLADSAAELTKAAAELRRAQDHLTAYLADPIGIAAPDTSSWPLPQRSSMVVTDQPAAFYRRFLDALPKRAAPDQPTHGVLTTEYGEHVGDVRSGRVGPGTGGVGLNPPMKHYSVATDHAEGHAAALLRNTLVPRGIYAAPLYVNNRPCSFRRGCDRTLPAQLPAECTLTVFWPGGMKVYRGRGDATT